MKDQLDEAIDHVAARMTHVDDDPALASRIAAALPERAGRSWTWLLPRLAITAGLAGAVALTVLRTFDEGSTSVLRSESARAPVVELARDIAAEAPGLANDRRTDVEPLSNDRGTDVEPLSNDRRTDADHEFSLAAITAPQALGVESLVHDDLPSESALAIVPLEIADLPLTADFPPR